MFEDPALEGKILRDMATAIAVGEDRDLVTAQDQARAERGLQLFSDTLYMATDRGLVFESCRADTENNLPEADM